MWTMMKTSRLMALACVLALGACKGGDASKESGEADSLSAPPADTTGSVVPLPPDSAAKTAADHDMMTVALESVNNSGITGEAVISGNNVVLSLSGAKAAGTHAAHVHTGTCASPGAPVAPLQPVTVDASGTGSSTSAISVDMMSLMDGNHIVSAHEAGGNPGAMVACGAIPAHQM